MLAADGARPRVYFDPPTAIRHFEKALCGMEALMASPPSRTDDVDIDLDDADLDEQPSESDVLHLQMSSRVSWLRTSLRLAARASPRPRS